MLSVLTGVRIKWGIFRENIIISFSSGQTKLSVIHGFPHQAGPPQSGVLLYVLYLLPQLTRNRERGKGKRKMNHDH